MKSATPLSPVRRADARVCRQVRHVDEAWERRFARKFAHVYAAGVIATDAGLMPCSVPHLRKCLLALYRRSRKACRSSASDMATNLRRLRQSVRSFLL